MPSLLSSSSKSQDYTSAASFFETAASNFLFLAGGSSPDSDSLVATALIPADLRNFALRLPEYIVAIVTVFIQSRNGNVDHYNGYAVYVYRNRDARLVNDDV